MKKSVYQPKHMGAYKFTAREEYYAPEHVRGLAFSDKFTAFLIFVAVLMIMLLAQIVENVEARADEGWAPLTIQEEGWGRMAKPTEATTYVYNGRTRVNLPEDVFTEINGWAEEYNQLLNEWQKQEPDAKYYGALQEGFLYCYQTLMSRLGYIDGFYAEGAGLVRGDDQSLLWMGHTLENDGAALQSAGLDRLWDQYETGSFGAID